MKGEEIQRFETRAEKKSHQYFESYEGSLQQDEHLHVSPVTLPVQGARKPLTLLLYLLPPGRFSVPGSDETAAHIQNSPKEVKKMHYKLESTSKFLCTSFQKKNISPKKHLF